MLRRLVGADIDQVCCWPAVLRNQHSTAPRRQLGNNFRRSPLETGDQLGVHKVILKYHLSKCNTEGLKANC